MTSKDIKKLRADARGFRRSAAKSLERAKRIEAAIKRLGKGGVEWVKAEAVALKNNTDYITKFNDFNDYGSAELERYSNGDWEKHTRSFVKHWRAEGCEGWMEVLVKRGSRMVDVKEWKKRGWKTQVYGYQLNEVVENILELYDEGGIRVDFGTKLRLVAFAPKVRVSSINSATNDTTAYFFNAVRADQESNHERRIRANFCTIRKVKS